MIFSRIGSGTKTLTRINGSNLLLAHEFQIFADLLLKFKTGIGGRDRPFDNVLPQGLWRKKERLVVMMKCEAHVFVK